MLFNSYIFILLFLPLTVGGYYFALKGKNRYLPKLWLLGMSLWFYAYFNIKYLPIILASIAVNYILYLCFSRLQKKWVRRLLLILGLTLNIGVLFYYKYLGFVTENINTLFKLDLTVIRLVLPLGISFFTFQQLSFVIDSYKGEVPRYNFLDYSLFVTFFPQLIAGPIVLHDEIVPQFADARKLRFNSKNFSKGIMAFAYGLAKKVLIADTIGNIANIGFGDVSALDTTNALIAVLAYSLQIYFDFSGYCDMATGIALFFNINLPMNFNSPYRATDIDDFWKRWHITLTRFLRTNIYFPLGGNRKGSARTLLNLFIVFFISGIWHGANWTFIIWGAIHGAAMIITRLLRPLIKKIPSYLSPLMWLVTFMFVCLAWVYFRADSVAQANTVIKAIFSFNFGAVNESYISAVQTAEFGLVSWLLAKLSPTLSGIFGKLLLSAFLLFGVFASAKMKNTNEKLKSFQPSSAYLALLCCLILWSLLSLSQVSTFLYFNF